jgi:hypothetical protein
MHVVFLTTELPEDGRWYCDDVRKCLNLYKPYGMKQWRIWRSINNIDHPHD